MRRLNIEQSEEATEDLRPQSIWYDVNAGQDVAERYLSSFVETAQQLAQQPDLGRKRHFRDPRLARLRSFTIQRAFNKHLIFYRIEADKLVIFRILHGMRDLPRRLLQPPGAED